MRTGRRQSEPAAYMIPVLVCMEIESTVPTRQHLPVWDWVSAWSAPRGTQVHLCRSYFSEFTLLLPPNWFCFYPPILLLIWKKGVSLYIVLTGVREGRGKQLLSSPSVFKFTFISPPPMQHTLGRVEAHKPVQLIVFASRAFQILFCGCTASAAWAPATAGTDPNAAALQGWPWSAHCLRTTHSTRAWAQWAPSPHSHTTYLSSAATEEHSLCPACF